MKTIPHNKPTLGSDEAAAAARVLRSGWVIGGSEVAKFEDTIKKMSGRKYAIAITSGTAALHLGLLALKVGKNDEVILPTYAPADLLNAVYYVNAKPVLVDVEKGSFNIDTAQVAKKVSARTKAMIIPHMYGSPAHLDRLKKFGVPIINDCAQALGTRYQGKPIGSFGDVGIFSFYATKIITCGQGGMLVTDDKKIYDFITDSINYNNRDYYKVRYNYPLTDIAASVANAQLKKLPGFIRRRKEIASAYQRILETKGIEHFPPRGDRNANYYRFIVKFSDEKERDRVRALFKKSGITTIIPLNEYELSHNQLGLRKKDFPISEDIAATNLSLPVYPSLNESEIERVCRVLRSLP
jgi:perosamine synthetase